MKYYFIGLMLVPIISIFLVCLAIYRTIMDILNYWIE